MMSVVWEMAFRILIVLIQNSYKTLEHDTIPFYIKVNVIQKNFSTGLEIKYWVTLSHKCKNMSIYLFFNCPKDTEVTSS